jgi:CHAT domain-containing protein
MRWGRGRRGSSEPESGDYYVAERVRIARKAFFAGSKYAMSSLGGIVAEWCAAAVEANDVEEAAEAHWHRVITAVRISSRQTHLEDRVGSLAAQRSLAGDAGYWLARAGRVEQAVRAVEFLRAVALSRLVGWSDPADAVALRQRGQDGLLQKYQEAQSTLADLARRQYAGLRTGVNPVTIAGRVYRLGAGNPIDEARAVVIDLEQQMDTALGRVPQTSPPPLSSIRPAADRYPLVYLAATDRSGYALIIRGNKAPGVVWLPLLTTGGLSALDPGVGVHRGKRRRKRQERAARPTFDWLARQALPPLAEELAGESLVTVVPVGVVSTLPLHAALPEAVHDRWPGRIPAVRYAPNARVISRLPEAGASPIAPDACVLAADAAQPARLAEHVELPPFKRVAQIAAGLRRLYGDRLTHLEAARADDVLAGLSKLSATDICHLTCHGVADPRRSLQSALLLVDRPLTAAEVFARVPTRLRLVILGSCETQVSDARVFDEVISFPSAWLQAGAQGVVALQWEVNQIAVALTMRHLHVQLVQGLPPAVALATAQWWLRHATAAELAQTYPDLYREPSGADAGSVPFEQPVDWAGFTYTGR